MRRERKGGREMDLPNQEENDKVENKMQDRGNHN